MARARIPKKVELKVLRQSGRRCVLCFGLDHSLERKKGQIAHIDQDSSNSAEDNLAFLCLLHHDEYDSRQSQSKGLTADELRAYRDDLYERIKGQRQEMASSPAVTPGPFIGSIAGVNRGRIINSQGTIRIVNPSGSATIGAIAGVNEGVIEDSRGEITLVPPDKKPK